MTQQEKHTSPLMSEELKTFLAERVYEKMRGALMLTAPDMKPWASLSEQERAQCVASMWMWVAGIGSNEVGHEWYLRSGQIPRAIWSQLPDFDHETSFVMAGIDLLFLLITLAERGLHIGHNEPMSQNDLWTRLNNGAQVRIGPCTIYRAHAERDNLKGNYVILYNGVATLDEYATIGEAAIAALTMLGDVKE